MWHNQVLISSYLQNRYDGNTRSFIEKWDRLQLATSWHIINKSKEYKSSELEICKLAAEERRLKIISWE